MMLFSIVIDTGVLENTSNGRIHDYNLNCKVFKELKG